MDDKSLFYDEETEAKYQIEPYEIVALWPTLTHKKYNFKWFNLIK